MIMNWISRMRGDLNGADANAMDPFPGTGPSPDGSRASAPLIDSDETLTGEFGRARRYEQTLTIAVVSAVRLDDRQAATDRADFLGTMRRPDVLPLLAGAGFREALRESDVLCYRPADRQFVLGLPQTDAEAARRAMQRVGSLFRSRLRIELVAGVAEFPNDGLTLEDLIETARAEVAPIDVGEARRAPSDGTSMRSGDSPDKRVPAPDRARQARAGSTTTFSHEAARSE